MEAAASLGVGENRLRRWQQTLEAHGDQAFPGPGDLPASGEEGRRGWAENQHLQVERDLVKQATASLAKES